MTKPQKKPIGRQREEREGKYIVQYEEIESETINTHRRILEPNKKHAQD